jgi:hypothetical protein
MAAPLRLSARFFGYNLDGAGSIEADQSTFVIRRPGTVASVSTWSPDGIAVSVDQLPIPEDRASQHPFAEVSTQSKSEIQTIVSVIRPTASGDAVPEITFESTAAGCRVSSDPATINLDLQAQIPRIGLS